MKTLWLQQNVTTSVDDPRMHHQLRPHELQVEDDFPQVCYSFHFILYHIVLQIPNVNDVNAIVI